MIFALLVVVLLGIDQASKYFIDSKMVVGDSIPVIDGIFHLTYVHNTGAAFSIFEGKVLFFIIFSMAAILFLIYLGWQMRKDKLSIAMITLSISGALGNLLDRVMLGYVRDFFDFKIWPVFNFADIYIVVGMIVLMMRMVWLDREEKKGSNEEDE